jgi:hypothetical protein
MNVGLERGLRMQHKSPFNLVSVARSRGDYLYRSCVVSCRVCMSLEAWWGADNKKERQRPYVLCTQVGRTRYPGFFACFPTRCYVSSMQGVDEKPGARSWSKLITNRMFTDYVQRELRVTYSTIVAVNRVARIGWNAAPR